jgi:hypothetical protein
LVLKDVYAQGWSATLNGEPVPIVRVNGLVRGVLVPGPGQYTVRFSYLPASFVYGAWLSLATALLLVAVAASAVLGRRSRRARHSRAIPMPATVESGLPVPAARDSNGATPSQTGEIVPHAP